MKVCKTWQRTESFHLQILGWSVYFHIYLVSVFTRHIFVWRINWMYYSCMILLEYVFMSIFGRLHHCMISIFRQESNIWTVLPLAPEPLDIAESWIFTKNSQHYRAKLTPVKIWTILYKHYQKFHIPIFGVLLCCVEQCCEINVRAQIHY